MGRPSSQNKVNFWLTLVITDLKLQKRPHRKLTRGGRPGVPLLESAVDESIFIKSNTFSVYSRTSLGVVSEPSVRRVNVSNRIWTSSVRGPPLEKFTSGISPP